MIQRLTLFLNQIQREVLIHTRQFKTMIDVSLFFVMFIVFFPLSLPADPELMRKIVPGLVWMAMLLALLLSADRLFQKDYERGVIEQWLISGESIPLMVSAKILVHWLASLLPVVLVCPLIAVLFSLTLHELWVLVLSLICGTPAILYLCALAAVFGVGSNQKTAFMALILLPLTLPVMIFGGATLSMAMQGLDIYGYLALLLAMSVLAIGLLPFAIAAVIKISLVD